MMEFAAIKERLLRLDASQLCDASPSVKVLDSSLKPINLGLKMAGVAHTVQTDGDVMPVLKAILSAQANDVIIVNTNNAKCAVMGEIFSTEAKKKNIAGIIIEGACRDSAYLKRLGLPIFCRAINPKVGTKNKIGETQVPIKLGEVMINPGDIIFADDDGIIVIKPEDILPTLQKAEEICAMEARVIKQIKNGVDLAELINFDEHYKELKQGITTGMLKFKNN